MKKKKENKLYWRRLDNSAKIFPISAGKKYSTVFRLSVVLTEKIEPNILKEAVNQALSKYVSFKVKMKTGFFWFYFEENQKGSIAPGKLADLVILDQNPLRVPPEKIKEIQVLYTIKEGEILYRKYR